MLWFGHYAGLGIFRYNGHHYGHFSYTHPPTIQERKRLDEDLSLIEEKVQGIIVLMRDCYGKNSNAAIRADEIAGAIQRLEWELERVQQKTQSANA